MSLFVPQVKEQLKVNNEYRLISHRGNVDGKNLQYENQPAYIDKALDLGYDCEIDLWHLNDTFYLGHDEATYPVNLKWLTERYLKLWIHCKNLNCLKVLSTTDLNCFAHENDSYVLTSHNYIWTFYGKELSERSVIVDINKNWPKMNYSCYGVCSDYM